MRVVRLILFCLLVALVAGVSTRVDAQPAPTPGDIDGDGGADLVVGVPSEGVAGRARAGFVNVIFSDGDRLVKDGNVGFDQTGVGGELAAGDLFGASIEVVDIDADGFADVVVGASGEASGLEVNAGAFTVVPGSADGPVTAEAQTYRQGDGLPDVAELDDFFGFSMTSGDFDGDGYGDLVVSAPFEDIDGFVDAGAVVVIPGSATGLATADAVLLRQTAAAGVLAGNEFFGWSVAAGDFDGDGHDDLAVSSPGEDTRGRNNAGAVVVFDGGPDGIDPDSGQVFSQSGPIKNSPEAEDFFGFDVDATDLDCDGDDDLLIGVPNETLGSAGIVAGIVNVVLGSDEGLTTSGTTRLAQGRDGVAGQRDYNQFGAKLATGDFDGDGCGDVAISAHTTDVGGDGVGLCSQDPNCAAEAGAVVIVYGSESWPRIGGTAHLTQRGPIRGRAEAGDFFGRTLTVLDVNGDGYDELVVGVPREDFRNAPDSGMVTVIRANSNGLTVRRDYSFTQAGSIAGKREAGDGFGSSLPGSTF